VTRGNQFLLVNMLTPVLTCVLPQYLDSAAVSAIRGNAALHPSAHYLILEADQVTHFDPVGVLRLWDFCHEQLSRGLRVELVHLHPALSHRLRAHPLMEFVADGDRIFQDPFASLEASQR